MKVLVVDKPSLKNIITECIASTALSLTIVPMIKELLRNNYSLSCIFPTPDLQNFYTGSKEWYILVSYRFFLSIPQFIQLNIRKWYFINIFFQIFSIHKIHLNKIENKNFAQYNVTFTLCIRKLENADDGGYVDTGG